MGSDTPAIAAAALQAPRPASSGASTQSIRSTSVSENSPYGVSGWLALFTIAAGIINPIRFLAEAVSGVGPVVALFDIPLGILSLTTGAMLLSKKPSALICVRIYLIVFFCLGALTLVGWVFSISAHSVDSFDQNSGMPTIAGAVIWFCYFRTSVRVKNTYGANI